MAKMLGKGGLKILNKGKSVFIDTQKIEIRGKSFFSVLYIN